MRCAALGLLALTSCSHVAASGPMEREPEPAPVMADATGTEPTGVGASPGLAEAPAPAMECPEETVPKTRGTLRDGESGCVLKHDLEVWHGPYAAWKCEPISTYRHECLRERGRFDRGQKVGAWQAFDVYGNETDADRH